MEPVVEQSGTIEIVAGGEAVSLWAQRAVLVRATGTLLVSDLHVGKLETIASAGVPLPEGTLQRDLGVLSEVIAKSGARRVVVLGDLLHARVGLTERVVDQVARWRSGHPGVWMGVVPGNHDRRLSEVAGTWGMEVMDAVTREGGVTLTHDASQIGPCAGLLVAGHVHPVATLRRGGDRLRLPAFVVSAARATGGQELTLPAFSQFTAGATVRSEAARIFVTTGSVVCEVSQTLMRGWVE